MSVRRKHRFSNSLRREESPSHHSTLPTQQVVDEIYSIQQKSDWRIKQTSHQHLQYEKEAEKQIGEMARQLKSQAIEIERQKYSITGLYTENNRLIGERDALLTDNRSLSQNNIYLTDVQSRELERLAKVNNGLMREHADLLANIQCLAEDNNSLREEITCLQTSYDAKHANSQKNILKNLEDEHSALLEEHLKMKNETVPDLRIQIHRLTQRRISSSPQR